MQIDPAFQQALQHHQRGQLDAAQNLYRQILAQNPNHADALHFLGIIAAQTGLPDEAVSLIKQSIALNPNLAEAHYNLGKALEKASQPDAAIASYRQAIALKPSHLNAHYNLGNMLLTRNALDAAVEAYRKAIALQPNFADAWANLASTLHLLRRYNESLSAFQKALTLKPNAAKVINNLGKLFAAMQQPDQAIAAFRKAAVVDPNYTDAHLQLAGALLDKNQTAEPIAILEKILAASPSHANALFRLGNAYWNAGKLDDAAAAFQKSIAADPANSAAHSNLIFTMAYLPQFDAAAYYAEARRWNDRFALPLKPLIRPHANDRTPNRRLNIGYVSADFQRHAIAYLFLPVLENHDPDNVHVTCYYNHTVVDPFTERIRKTSHQWRDIARLPDKDVVDQIRDDDIDILVDLSGHTANHRLQVFAQKPAPIAATWLAPPNTTGLDAIDYRFSDRFLDPPELATDPFYSEKIFRLPDTFWCYDPLATDPPVNPLPALSTGRFTFGCLNNFYKITQSTIALWSRILNQAPNSRLLLLSFEGPLRQKTLDTFARHGITPDRVEFSGRVKHAEYLKLYHQIDLSLDTLPYNGHTTTFDSLWMAVPVVTLPGNTAVGRAGAGFMSNINLPHFIAQTPDDYLNIALHWATHLPELAALRATMRQSMQQSPLMNAKRFAQNLETAYRQMWQTWLAT